MNQSFAITPTQYKNGTKNVTRRNGWNHIKIGKVMNGVNKTMGFKKGEKPVIFGRHVPISSRREPLRKMLDDYQYGLRECVREGFPTWTPEQFVEMYCKHNKVTPDFEVNRIAFRRVLSWNELPPIPETPCPVCKDGVVVLTEITGGTEAKFGLWMADEIHVDCSTFPGFDDSELFDAHMASHWSMPYVDWLPLTEKIKAWLSAHFWFEDAESIRKGL